MAYWHIIKAKSETKHTDLHLKLSCHFLDGQILKSQDIEHGQPTLEVYKVRRGAVGRHKNFVLKLQVVWESKW